MLKKTRKGTSIIEISVLMLIIPILTMTFGNIGLLSLKKFKEAQMYSIVLKGNTMFLKRLGGIRFGNEVKWLDNSTNRATIRIGIGEDSEIQFIGDNGNSSNDDVIYKNETGNEVYLYDKELLKFKKFKVIQLNNSINRTGLKFDIEFGLSGKDSVLTATRFGKDSEFFLRYPITYTFRNVKQ